MVKIMIMWLKLFCMIGDSLTNSMRKILLKLKKQHGISLLELIVAIGIFVIVSLVASGIYINVVNSQRQSIGAQTTQESLRFAFELMSKELRTAQGEFNGSSCAKIDGTITGYNKIFNNKNNDSQIDTTKLHFKNKDGDCVSYEKVADGVIDRIKIIRNDVVTYGYITPNELDIKSLQFIIKDQKANEIGAVQPSITMMVEAEMKNGPKETIRMQTTISSRDYTY